VHGPQSEPALQACIDIRMSKHYPAR
jgi:hypothetical protein